jgi:hypothetical protein
MGKKLLRSREQWGTGKSRTTKENEMKEVSYIIGNAGDINLVTDGKSHTIAVDHANYQEIVDRLVDENYDEIENLLDVASSIALVSEGEVTVLDGCVCYKGSEVVNPLTERILRFVKEGLPFKPMTRFLENLMDNPSRTSIQELYLFLESNTLPITEDGCFLAYRKVDNDYMSYHSNPDGTKNSNKVGDVVEQERNEVDDERDNVCSNGLHFCSMDYLPHYYGGNGRVMIVKIDPKNVVSIPSDYDNAKGRTCKYEVVGEHTDPEKEYKPWTEAAVTAPDGSEIDYHDEDEDGVCFGCGEDYEDCTCDTCFDCGCHVDDCECNEQAELDLDNDNDTCGHKPSGQKFHNVRDGAGRFTKRG